MSSDAAPPPAEPKKIIAGRYRLGKTLGQGTFGQVFYAEDIKFDPPRAVAVKLLHSQFLSDAQSREDIRREASVLARFHHPNILRVSDFEISSDMAYIVTDFAEGGSLMKKLRPDAGAPPIPMSLGEVVYYLEQIASALDEAHNLGLIHRDIKPLNILLDRAGRPLLADFGLATVLAGSASSIVTDLSTSGTPLYMAPEQWAGKAGKASDIYALGVVTYQLITGQPPYTGNQTALWAQHTGAAIPALREKAPWLDYPPALDSVIAGAMAKDDRERTRPAGEFARRFKSAMMGNPAFQINNRNQSSGFIQPGSTNSAPVSSGPLSGPIASMTPGIASSNLPNSYPTVGSFNTPSQGYGQAPSQTNANTQALPPNQSQPGQAIGPAQPGSQPQVWQPGGAGSIPPGSPPQAWQQPNNGPQPPPPPTGAWQGGPYATPQPPGWSGNAPVVTKKKGGLNPLVLVAGLVVLLVIAAAGVFFVLPKGNSSPTQVAINVTVTSGATAAGTARTTAAGTVANPGASPAATASNPGASSAATASNPGASPAATVSGPAATAAALVGTGQLQVTITESSGKPARAGDLVIKVYTSGNTVDAIDTVYSKSDTTFNLKAGSYQVEVSYLNDVKVVGPVAEIKEGQPVKQAINLGLGQVQVDVVEATGKSARLFNLVGVSRFKLVRPRLEINRGLGLVVDRRNNFAGIAILVKLQDYIAITGALAGRFYHVHLNLP